MKHLIIGLGEVGKALLEILSTEFEVETIDSYKKEVPKGRFAYIHVCIPYKDESFIETVQEYVLQYGSADVVTIVHSSVPVGTTSKLIDAVHSPIRGVHPHLVEGIRTFKKFIGGEKAEEVALLFKKCGIETVVTYKPENTEALKLWDTTYYYWNIHLMRAVYNYCEKYGLDFNLVYTDANKFYNDGFTELGRLDVVRPVLKYMPGETGGHCLVPNARLLGDEPIALFLLNEEKQLAHRKKNDNDDKGVSNQNVF